MASMMKVLQIESVVVSLISRRGIEYAGVDLKLKHDDGSLYEQHDVRALTHARDKKLEVDVDWPLQPCQYGL